MNKRKSISKIIKSLFFMSIFMLLQLPAIPGHAQGSGVYLTVEGSPTAGEHTVSVFVQEISPVYGADIRLAFDPNVLQVVDADESTPDIIEHGDFLTANPDFVLRNQANNQTGQIEYALVLVNPAEPVQGDGLLAKVTFRARASAQTEVSLTQAQFGTREGEVIEPALAEAVEFSVTASGETAVEPTSAEASSSTTFLPKEDTTTLVKETFSTEWLIAGAVAIALVLLLLIIIVWWQLKRSQQATAYSQQGANTSR